MTSFVQPSFPTKHAGLVRVQAAWTALSELRSGFNATRGLSTMLLAAMVSALLVVADQLIDTWADGHLLAAWIALWLVGFATIAIFAGAARKLAATAVSSLDAWSRRVAASRADERLWRFAQTDARVMADLKAAVLRSQR